MFNQYNKQTYVIDNHCHISFPQPIEETLACYEEVFQELGISAAGLLAGPGSSHCENKKTDFTENLKMLYLKDRLSIPCYAYANFTEYNGDPDSSALFAETMLKMGFDGFKSTVEHPRRRKQIGMGYPHPFFQPFFERMNQEHATVVCHVGDPRTSWFEATPYNIENGRVYGSEHMTLDQLHAEMEEVIAKYPDIHFILAHFYFVSDNYDKACYLMEHYPNVYFDICPGGEMFVNFNKNTAQWREFFLRYHKRIIMGSDLYALGYGKDRHELARSYVEGTEPFLYKDNMIQPLHLAENILQDIYGNNIKRLIGDTPKSIDRNLAVQYCDYLKEKHWEKLTELQRKNLETIKRHFSHIEGEFKTKALIK